VQRREKEPGGRRLCKFRKNEQEEEEENTGLPPGD
jgi:hypothetical protein